MNTKLSRKLALLAMLSIGPSMSVMAQSETAVPLAAPPAANVAAAHQIPVRVMIVAFGDGYLVTEDGGTRWRLAQASELGELPVPLLRQLRALRTGVATRSASVAPNPASGLVTMNYSTDVPGPVTISVADGRGVEVLRTVAAAPAAGTYSENVDLSSLPSGLYYYHVANGEGPVGSGVVTVVR